MRQERNRKLAERLRLEEEREAKSLIPLNQDYEQHIFDRRNITWNCDLIADLMFAETSRIRKLTEDGSYQEAALRFMQLTKSMCLHFVKDEHYNYFDDMYSPEYAVDNLTDLFRQLDKAGKLPEETKEYLSQAWKEIESSECCRDYGLPRTTLVF